MRSLACCLALLLCVAMIPAAADFPAGLAAYQKGDYATAAKEWRPIAEQGDPAVQFNVGLLYEQGQGVPLSYEQAAEWFKRAAEQDYTKAQHNLGAMYAVGRGVKRDYVQAYKWLNVCAAKGDAGCVSQRDQVAKKLKGNQLSAAQRLATQFAPKKESEKQ